MFEFLMLLGFFAAGISHMMPRGFQIGGLVGKKCGRKTDAWAD